MPASSQVLDPVQVTFDDRRAVADAGLVLTGTPIGRLSFEQAIDERASRGHRPGRTFLTVVSTLLAGGDCIDDVNLLHAGATSSIVGHDTVAAPTVGSWRRSLTFGHIRQLVAVTETALARAWQAGAGTGDAPVFIDVDSTICEIHGDAKQGAVYGYTRALGLHPLVASPAGTGEILHARMRKGSAGSGRGAGGSCAKRSAGSAGPVRPAGCASGWAQGFWSRKVITACEDHGAQFSITVARQPVIATAIDAIDEQGWVDIAYTDGGTARVAETVWDRWRLIVRRTRIDNGPNLPTQFAG